MRIRFTTSVAGANFAYRRKQEVELPEHRARVFLAAGQAVPVADAPEPREAAALELPGLRRRRRGARPIETAEHGALESRG